MGRRSGCEKLGSSRYKRRELTGEHSPDRLVHPLLLRVAMGLLLELSLFDECADVHPHLRESILNGIVNVEFAFDFAQECLRLNHSL